MKAFGLGREEIAKDLVEAGGDPYLKDNQGHTACDYAKMNKNDFMLGLIGQKVNAEESDDLGD